MTTNKRRARREQDDVLALHDLDERSWKAASYVLIGVLLILLGVWKLQNIVTTAIDQRLELEDRLEARNEPTSSPSEPPKT